MDGVFDAFDVAAAQAFHLAAQLEVAADGGVVQDAEAVDDGHGAAGLGDDDVGIEVEVGLVAYRQDDGVGAPEGGGQVRLDPEIRKALLIPEEAGPGMAGLTEVLLIGIEMRWIRARVRPMASGANPVGACLVVTPRMTNRKNAVSSTSARNTAHIE